MIKANAEKLKQTELMSAPQVKLPEIIVQEPTVVLAANEESKINMQLIDYSDDYSDTSSGSRLNLINIESFSNIFVTREEQLSAWSIVRLDKNRIL